METKIAQAVKASIMYDKIYSLPIHPTFVDDCIGYLKNEADNRDLEYDYVYNADIVEFWAYYPQSENTEDTVFRVHLIAE